MGPPGSLTISLSVWACEFTEGRLSSARRCLCSTPLTAGRRCDVMSVHGANETQI